MTLTMYSDISETCRNLGNATILHINIHSASESSSSTAEDESSSQAERAGFGRALYYCTAETSQVLVVEKRLRCLLSLSSQRSTCVCGTYFFSNYFYATLYLELLGHESGQIAFDLRYHSRPQLQGGTQRQPNEPAPSLSWLDRKGSTQNI